MSLQLGQLSSTLQKLSDAGGRSARESRFFESLHYDRMRARQENIIDAHAQTFEWVLDPHQLSSGLDSKDSFLEWLTNGNGIFWITGKAGSGKSTLSASFATFEPCKSHAVYRKVGNSGWPISSPWVGRTVTPEGIFRPVATA